MPKGIFSFLLVLAFIPLLLAFSSFEHNLQDSFSQAKTIALQMEKTNFLRTELELNSDEIIREILLEALKAKTSAKTATEFASAFPNSDFSSLISDNNLIDEAAHLAIAFSLADYYQKTEETCNKQESCLIKFYFDEFNPGKASLSQLASGRQEVKRLEWQDIWQNSATLIDAEKEAALFTFAGRKKSLAPEKVVFAIISLQDFRQVFIIPQGYSIEVRP